MWVAHTSDLSPLADYESEQERTVATTYLNSEHHSGFDALNPGARCRQFRPASGLWVLQGPGCARLSDRRGRGSVSVVPFRPAVRLRFPQSKGDDQMRLIPPADGQTVLSGPATHDHPHHRDHCQSESRNGSACECLSDCSTNGVQHRAGRVTSPYPVFPSTPPIPPETSPPSAPPDRNPACPNRVAGCALR